MFSQSDFLKATGNWYASLACFSPRVTSAHPWLTLLSILFASLIPLRAPRAQTTTPPSTTRLTVDANRPLTRQLNAKGAVKPVRWRLISGSLPPGMTLSISGLLDGTPTVAQTTPFSFTLEATDSSDPQPQTFRQDFEILVRGGISEITLEPVTDNIDVARAEAARAEATPSPTPLCNASDIASNADTISIAVGNELQGGLADSGIEFESAGVIKKDPIKTPAALIQNTLGTLCKMTWQKDDYVIVHLIRWPSSLKAGQQKYDPRFEKWFLYRNLNASDQSPEWELQTAQDGTRIYGHKRVAVLLVHAGALQTWDIRYTVDLKGKTAAPIQNVLDLAGIIAGGKTARIEATPTSNLWGGRLLNVKDIPSDLIVQSNFVFVNNTTKANSKEGDDSQQTQQAQAYNKTYDNEGRYHWDVSAGIPVKGFKEVTYDVESQQVTAKEINRQNAYGFLNLFFNPRGVDTKGDQFYKTPHLVLGVPISGKPLDRPLVGLGIGFYKPQVKFNLFGGIVFNRVREPQTLGAGQAATPAQLQADLRTRRIRKFLFGINLPIKQFKDALSKQKK